LLRTKELGAGPDFRITVLASPNQFRDSVLMNICDEKYLQLRVLLLQIENYENIRLNSSRPHQGTIQIRIEYNNIKKCRPLTEIMVEATSSHPLSSR